MFHKCADSVGCQEWTQQADNTGQHTDQLARQTDSQARPDSSQEPEKQQLLKITRTSWPATVSLSLSSSSLSTGHCLPAYPVESFRQITFFCKIFHLKTKHKAQRVAKEKERERRRVCPKAANLREPSRETT